MATSSVSMNLKKMEQLIENLKHRAIIEVGVFSSKAARKSGDLTNAQLAQIHELGSPEHNIPARSMLKVPIADHAQEIMAPFKGKADAFLAKGTLLNLYKLIGVACEKVVDGAFNSGGYGKWAPLKADTVWSKLRWNAKGKKRSYQQVLQKMFEVELGDAGTGILIRTSQLRRAFSSKVKMTF